MDLTERAMLVRLSVSQWSGQKKDKRVSEEVSQRHNASRDAGSYSKKLVSSFLFDEFQSIAAAARSYHSAVTLPWLDGGFRILPSALYFEYREKMSGYRHQMEEVAEKIVEPANYERMLNTAKARLGELYQEDDFPAPDQLRSKFSMGVTMMPLPGTDFRLDINEDAQKEIRTEVEANQQEAMKIAVKDVWLRMYDAVEKLSVRIDGTSKRIHTSLMENLREMVELLPKLNITNDPDLDQMAEEIKDRICSVSVNALRSTPGVRQDTHKASVDILERMKSAGYV